MAKSLSKILIFIVKRGKQEKANLIMTKSINLFYLNMDYYKNSFYYFKLYNYTAQITKSWRNRLRKIRTMS